MMTKEQAAELGRRAVAAGWEWQPGARTTSGDRACAIFRREALWMCGAIATKPAWGDIRPYHAPDFRDPATLGILRQQVVALKPGAVAVGMQILQFSERNVRVYWVSIAGDYGVPSWCPKQTLELKCSPDVWPIEALVGCLEAAKEIRL